MNFFLVLLCVFNFHLNAQDTFKRFGSLENFMDEKYPLVECNKKFVIKDMKFENEDRYHSFIKYLIASAANHDYDIPNSICEEILTETTQDITVKPLQENFLRYIKNKKEVDEVFLRRIIKKDNKIKDFILKNLKDIKIKKESYFLSHLEKILFYISTIEEKDDFFYIKFIWDDEVVLYKDINKEGVLCNLTNAVVRCVKKEDIFSFSNTYSNIIDYIKTGDKFYFLNYLLENEFNLDIVCYFFDKMDIEKNKDIFILNNFFEKEIQNIFSDNEKDINFIDLEYFSGGPLFNKREQLITYIDFFFRNNYLTCERREDFKERIFKQDIKLFEKVLSHYKKTKDISIIIKKLLPYIDIHTKEQKKIISKMILMSLKESSNKFLKAYDDINNYMISEDILAYKAFSLTWLGKIIKVILH